MVFLSYICNHVNAVFRKSYLMYWEAHGAGFRIGTHANGDVALEQVIGVYEAIHQRKPEPKLHHYLISIYYVGKAVLKGKRVTLITLKLLRHLSLYVALKELHPNI
jgi:hypothetical protein